MILCPYCLSGIDENTDFCPNCLTSITDAIIEMTSTEYEAEEKQECPYCGYPNLAIAVRCPACHQWYQTPGQTE